MKDDKTIRIMCYSFFVIFGLGSFITFLLTVCYPIYEFITVNFWYQVPCKIEKAEVQEWEETRPNSPRRYQFYRPLVVYSYIFQGKEYQSDRLTLSSFRYSSTSKKKAEDTIELFLKTTVSHCYVNPENPKQVVLYFTFPTWGIALGTLMFVIFGGISFLFFYVGKKF